MCFLPSLYLFDRVSIEIFCEIFNGLFVIELLTSLHRDTSPMCFVTMLSQSVALLIFFFFFLLNLLG